MTVPALSARCRAFTLTEEGVDQPSVWPGGGSGVTIGPGYDLGQVTHAEFAADWKAHLPPTDFARLDAVVGLKGDVARKAATTLKDIHIPISVGIDIFDSLDVPQYCALTARTYPGCEALPPDVFGMLFDLTYNRGASLVGPSRVELFALSQIIPQYGQTRDLELRADILRSLAHQVRSMKRRWPRMSALYGRCERRALVIESCIS